MLDLNTSCKYPKQKADKDGYVRMTINQVRVLAHRKAWEDAYGPIPEGWKVEHACHLADPTCPLGVCLHKSCINPKHLELAPPKSEMPKGTKPRRRNSRCGYGHEYTEKNTYIIPGTGKRACRMCKFLLHQEQLRKKKLVEYGLEES